MPKDARILRLKAFSWGPVLPTLVGESDVKSPRTGCIELIAARHACGGVRTVDER
jgi:hypothetical protein